MNGRAWWQEGVIYQIYPRSFQDSNGDGVGDIPGIIRRLDDIAALGVSAIWLSPVYRSPQIDNGYDISDYRDIDPLFGTLAGMDALIAAAAARGLKIIMDLVINHTSCRHEWFQKSRRREEPWTDYYIWHPGESGGRPPNNWTSFFMDEAWSFDEVRGEWYLHLFHRKQPDLNYRNPRVLEEVKEIMRFWLERGVAGFRCDVINVLWKESLERGRKSVLPVGLEHYKCREGNHAILRELRRDVLDAYGAFAVGETVLCGLEETKLLCDRARGELDMAFYFDHLEVDRRLSRFIPKRFRAAELLRRLETWQRGLEWNALYLENHDQSRAVSHYGDPRGAGTRGSPWERSAKMLAALLFTLRGTPFVYQGQETGMTNFDFSGIDEVKDIETRNLDRFLRRLHVPAPLRWHWLRASSRDNARTPYQWNADGSAGFSAGAPWLPVNRNYTRLNRAAQENDPDSVLSFYKKMITFRASSGALKYGAFTALGARGSLVFYRRSGEGETFTIALNFSGRRRVLAARERAWLAGDVVLDSGAEAAGTRACGAGTGEAPRFLEGWQAVITQKTPRPA